MSADVAAHALAVAAGDPSANRVVYGAVIALVVIGVILLGVAVWLFRQTRVDPELLAPLERMADRSWTKLDPATQRRMLDEVRPAGALPLHREPSAPVPDEEFDKPLRPVSSYEDLKDPEPDAAGGDDEPEPAAVESAAVESAAVESADGGGDDPEVDEAALDNSTETSDQAEPASDEGTETSDQTEPATDEPDDAVELPEAAADDEPDETVEPAEAAAVDEPDETVEPAEAAAVDERDDDLEAPNGDGVTGEASINDDEAADGEASDEGQPNSAWPSPEDAGARPT